MTWHKLYLKSSLKNVRKMGWKNVFRAGFFHLSSLLLVIASVAFITTPINVGAVDLSCDQDFLSNNDIIMYNPCVSQCTNAKPQAAVVSSLRGDNNGEKVFNFWVDAGLSPQQASGVTANIKDVSGLNAFYQQDDTWGIAGFTNKLSGAPGLDSDKTGQLDKVKSYVKSLVGEDTFNKYDSSDYGGVVLESNGFKPDGVDDATNDKFLLPELNYLLSYMQLYKPFYDQDKLTTYTADTTKTVGDDDTLFKYLTSLTKADDVSTAWVYLYEYHESGADLKGIATTTSAAAKDILKLYGKGITSGCGGGLVEGGMNLEQAKEFMKTYLLINDGDPNGDAKYIIPGTCHTKTDNCTAFSSYFTMKYTTVIYNKGNAHDVVNNILARNPDVESGKDPQPYSVFSTDLGTTTADCGGICGHTGIILGVDLERNVVIIGEAAYCKNSGSAREAPLSAYSSSAGNYTYAYLEPFLKSDIGVDE